jgi:deazaflavin-dependent oxidoreductase (nitroreductase family)
VTGVNWQQSINDFGGKVMSRSHRAILSLSGGRVLNSAFGMPAVELQTIGRSSGVVRRTMLTTPVHDEHRVVLVASKGGDDRHPHWYGNLTANPDVKVTIAGVTRSMRARTATEEERTTLWPQIVASYKGYGGYQEKTTRQIPVVICESAPS